jgi:hypothetical protein
VGGRSRGSLSTASTTTPFSVSAVSYRSGMSSCRWASPVGPLLLDGRRFYISMATTRGASSPAPTTGASPSPSPAAPAASCTGPSPHRVTRRRAQGLPCGSSGPNGGWCGGGFRGAQSVICFLRHSGVIPLQTFFGTPLEIVFFGCSMFSQRTPIWRFGSPKWVSSVGDSLTLSYLIPRPFLRENITK